MPLSFAAPWALAALAGLVAVWWLLRIRPPAPRRLRFPAIRLLFGLDDREEPPHTTPWWLLILRMALFTLVVLAAAGPRWDSEPALDGEGTLVLVVDDGWASARGWESTRRSLLQAVDAAQVRGRSVVLAGTAPGTDWFRSQAAVAAEEAARLARVLAPQPWGVDRRAFLESLVGAELAGTGEILWFWDGTDGGDPEATALLAQQLSRIGPLSLMGGPEHEAPLLLLPAPDDADGMAPEVRRTHETGNEEVWVRAMSLEGRVLTRVATTMADGERIARAPLGLPRELRRDVTRVEIEGQRHAGAVVLVDDRWQRRTVGLVTMGDDYAARPLLAPTYYLRRALEPFAEIRQGPLAALLEDPPSVIVLADVGQLRPEGRDALTAWLDSGGTLVRFAGERLVDANSPLLPVKLREGEMRALGGAFSWEQPFSLGPFPSESPFAGLEVPDDILIRRQMIAEPSALLDDRTMARLADGTPLVTAAQSGRGELVFFHVTANTDWSNLPLSGLFVSMLQRLVERAEGGEGQLGSEVLPPLTVLDGFGREMAPPPDAVPVGAEQLLEGVPGPGHPPGYYGHELFRRALNLGGSVADVRAYRGPLPDGVNAVARFGTTTVDLSAWLFALALALLLVDIVAGLALRGLIDWQGWASALIALAALGVADARAEEPVPVGALAIQFGYVVTGNAEVDRTSALGLTALGRVLAERTSVVPVPPQPIDIERDPLVFHPFVYWPMTDLQAAVSEAAVARIEAYLQSGGLIVFDTRDGSPVAQLDAARRADPRLAKVLGSLDLPPLVPVSGGHVLGRSFYLLGSFPGRWAGNQVWIESTADRSRDEVAGVVVGAAGWAAAWATDPTGRPLFPVTPGGERQRELAYRFGVNLAMYAMTGNYKSDQAHTRTILQRLRRAVERR